MTIGELERKLAEVDNMSGPPSFKEKIRAKYREAIAKLKQQAIEKEGYVNADAKQGAQRAKDLYGMDAKQIGTETQDVISRYKAKLDDKSQSANRANTLKRQARANKGGNLSAGENSQLDRNAAFDTNAEASNNLKNYRNIIGHIAANTGSLEMGFGGLGVAKQPVAVAEDTGGSVICTELNRQGILSDYLYEKDSKYGYNLYKCNPAAYYGYFIWARYVAKAMSKSKIITAIIKPFALAWARQISGEKNFLGFIIEKFGLKLCTAIGNNIKWEYLNER